MTRDALASIAALHGPVESVKLAWVIDPFDAEPEYRTECEADRLPFPCATRKLADEGLAGDGHDSHHDGTARHNHNQTGAVVWWTNVEHFGGDYRKHRHDAPVGTLTAVARELAATWAPYTRKLADEGLASGVDGWIDLAADIRAVDGNHDLGAGPLAHALIRRGWTRATEDNATRETLELAGEGLAGGLELAHLREALAREERDHLRTIDQRDTAQDWADRLAYAIAPLDVIGEHSNMNDPWQNALDHLERDLMRRLLATHDAMCDISHHDRPPARCSQWAKYPNIARFVAPRLRKALADLDAKVEEMP